MLSEDWTLSWLLSIYSPRLACVALGTFGGKGTKLRFSQDGTPSIDNNGKPELLQWVHLNAGVASSIDMDKDKEMAFNCIQPLRNLTNTRGVIGIGGSRTFAVGGGKKKGSKGGAAGDAPKASTLSKEVKSTTVVGANILKDGTDPKVLADSEYPDWLWHLLDKQPALSELRRKNIKTLPYEELKRFVKLDNRARIKENNSIKAKN
ncbi:Ribosomal protein L37, mitochondrial [Dillenia turbinata]|uniref:Large ribosomal subunit protein mL54 n=1 Tax=Dillenia turbinata TaxID=194707 RepID=A0AAN8VJH8_9MAGN